MVIQFWYNSLDVSQFLSIKAKTFMGAVSHKTECNADVGGDTLSLGLPKRSSYGLMPLDEISE